MEFQTLFRNAKGQPIVYKDKELRMLDKITLATVKSHIKVTFISTDSQWKQGIILKTKGSFIVNDQTIPDKIVLWEHTAPKEIDISIMSEDKLLIIYNAWIGSRGSIQSWTNGSAMHVEIIDNVRIYNCNDGYPDDDLNDLIFKVEF